MPRVFLEPGLAKVFQFPNFQAPSTRNGLTNLAIHDIYRDQDEANQLQNAVPQGSAVNLGPKQRLGDLLPALNGILNTFELPQLPQDALDTDILAGPTKWTYGKQNGYVGKSWLVLTWLSLMGQHLPHQKVSTSTEHINISTYSRFYGNSTAPQACCEVATSPTRTRTFHWSSIWWYLFQASAWPLAGLKCVLVRVAPTGAEEPTMDLRKLPLGIEVADPEATGGGTVGLGEDPNWGKEKTRDSMVFHFDAAGSSFQVWCSPEVRGVWISKSQLARWGKPWPCWDFFMAWNFNSCRCHCDP